MEQGQQSQGSRRILVGVLVGCGVLLVLSLLLVVALIVGVGIGMSGSGKGGTTNEGATTNTPKQVDSDEEYIPLVIRLSGEQGTPYRCSYNTVSDQGDIEGERVSEEQSGKLGSRPIEFRAQIENLDYRGPSSTFSSSCSIDDPTHNGRLRVELLVNDQVVDSGETRPDPSGQKSESSFRVQVSYSAPDGGPVEVKGKGKDKK